MTTAQRNRWEPTGTFYDGFDLEFDDCSGFTGHPYLYYGGSDTSFVFGSDGFLHVESCFNVIAGTFQGNELGILYFVDPAGPGTGGFVGAHCSDAGGYLACTGSNGETVFYLPDYSFGVSSELYFGDANYGTNIDVQINYWLEAEP